MAEPEWTAIILAGQRPGEDDFATAHGVAAKALIPVHGEPMLGRVTRTLLACPSIGGIVVLAQQPETLLGGELAWIAGHPRVTTATAGEGISASIAAIAGSAAAPYPLLVTTADHALLTAAMVEAFLIGAAGSDVAFGVVGKAAVTAAYPETRRTWMTFSDGGYTGANLFALSTPASRTALEFWARAEKDRKKAWRLLQFFGPRLLFRVATRTISIDAMTKRAGRNENLILRSVKLPFAEAAIDVDKPSDLILAGRILAARAHAEVVS